MIVKPYESIATVSGVRQQASSAAERQMAHYLHRAVKNDPGAQVLNDLGLEDTERPEQDETIGVCQIDHLVIHRWGMFIIEASPSRERYRSGPTAPAATSGPGFRRQGSRYASPIRQAERQAQFLRAILQRHQELVGRVPLGMRTLARLVRGSDQRTFKP